MAGRRIEERRAEHARYKEDVKRRGKPFYPHAMFHDTVMSLVVVAVIIGLTVVWRATSDGIDSGWLGPLYAEKADPGTTEFIPRPDWYFYFLFYLLRIFKWPESLFLATVGIPTLLLILLAAMPFLDVRRERRLSRRPVAVVASILVVVSMGVLTWKGATAKEALASEIVELVPEWAERQGFADNAEAVEGGELYARAGCISCHTFLGAGNANLGAPDLTEVGAKGRGIEWQIEHLKNPASTTPGSQMPGFAGLGDENLKKIAVFLEASKGAKKE